MKQVTLYTRSFCPFCLGAKQMLGDLGVKFTEINVGNDPVKREELATKYNWPTLPMIVVGDEFIGGFDDLRTLHAEGKFLPKLVD